MLLRLSSLVVAEARWGLEAMINPSAAPVARAPIAVAAIMTPRRVRLGVLTRKVVPWRGAVEM